MKLFAHFFFSCLFFVFLLPVKGFTQNVGINTITPEAVLDINGDIIFRPGNIVVADGITLALDVNSARFSYYRVTGPTADFTLAGITAGIDGRLVTLFNRSGFTMQLNNEDASAAPTEMIITGTNTDITIGNKSIVTLQYDGDEGKWILKSSSKGSTGATGGYPVHSIGESYGGGIVFYVFDGGQHGLISATSDQSTAIAWSNGTLRSTGSKGDGVAAGTMNTAMIVSTQISDNQTGNFSAKVCADYSVTVDDVTYGDWYLPSKFELNLLYLQKSVVGGFASTTYWSSSEINNNEAWSQFFVSGLTINDTKFNGRYVRAIRAF